MGPLVSHADNSLEKVRTCPKCGLLLTGRPMGRPRPQGDFLRISKRHVGHEKHAARKAKT